MFGCERCSGGGGDVWDASALFLNARDVAGVMVGPRNAFGGGDMVLDVFASRLDIALLSDF